MQAPLVSNPHPLFVRRCLLRDTVVPIPEPEDLIVNYIEPSHVVVQRCTGKKERKKLRPMHENGVGVSCLAQVPVLAFSSSS